MRVVGHADVSLDPTVRRNLHKRLLKMSYCRQEGKDQIIFMTKEDLEKPSSALITLTEDEDEEPGLILSDGQINWNCPCLGGLASGPCGVPFRDAFSCFHYSKTEPKGSDCYEQFKGMQDCMTNFPDLYPAKEDNEEVAAGLNPDLSEDLEEVNTEKKDALGTTGSIEKEATSKGITDKNS